MKIILSRKGFDSSCGGVASPILPDGAMVSLPVPERPAAAAPKTRTYGQSARRRGPPADSRPI